MLDERKMKILQAIINDYIATAEPVGSRSIARNYRLGISAATIRNEMADLEVLGYLEQPHTSAGRIPSAKGYRFYVDCLLSPTQITDREISLIKQWYDTKVRRIDEVFQQTAKILSRMTRNVSLVLAPQLTQCTFKYMQFLPLDEDKAIIVLVTDSGLIDNKIIQIPQDISFEDLERIAAKINRRLSGLTFDAIKSSIMKEIRTEVIPDKRLFDTTMQIIEEALLTTHGEKIYKGGTTQLLGQPEFRDVEKVKDLLNMLEEEKLLCDIMHMTDEQGVVVTIGHENKYSGIQNCSVIQATYRFGNDIVGSIAVLGPTRMEYAKIMSVLEFMHTNLGDILKKYKFK